MVGFAHAAGLSVVAAIKEIGSGVNDSRPKLTALLKDSWGTLVVEHKDRPSRVGFGWLGVLLGISGRRIMVAEVSREQTADLMDDVVSIIDSVAARRYGVGSARRRPAHLVAALGSETAEGQAGRVRDR